VEVLREILLLKLESARTALLRNDEQLFRDSLATAIDWIGQHFDMAAAETKGMQDELNSMADRSFVVAYPDISKSMIMLQNIEKLRLEAEEAAMRSKPGNEVSEKAQPVTAPPAPSVSQMPEAAAPKDAKGKKADKAAPGKKGKHASNTESVPAEMAPGTGETPAAEPASIEPESAETLSESGPAPAAPPVSESEPAQPAATPNAESTLPEAKPIDESGERL